MPTDLVFKAAYPAWNFRLDGPLSGGVDNWKKLGPKAIRRHELRDKFLRRVSASGKKAGVPELPPSSADLELDVEVWWEGAQPIPACEIVQAIAFGLWGKKADRIISVAYSAYEYCEREYAEVIVRRLRDDPV